MLDCREIGRTCKSVGKKTVWHCWDSVSLFKQDLWLFYKTFLILACSLLWFFLFKWMGWWYFWIPCGNCSASVSNFNQELWLLWKSFWSLLTHFFNFSCWSALFGGTPGYIVELRGIPINANTGEKPYNYFCYAFLMDGAIAPWYNCTVDASKVAKRAWEGNDVWFLSFLSTFKKTERGMVKAGTQNGGSEIMWIILNLTWSY